MRKFKAKQVNYNEMKMTDGEKKTLNNKGDSLIKIRNRAKQAFKNRHSDTVIS